MNQIEHDQNEPKIDRDPFPWWMGWTVLAALWIGQGYFDGFDWVQLLLGVGTGAMLAAWAIEKTGNRIPDTWRSKR